MTDGILEHALLQVIPGREVGFRGSPQYEQWRALLHEFYEPFPVVEHFTEVR